MTYNNIDENSNVCCHSILYTLNPFLAIALPRKKALQPILFCFQTSLQAYALRFIWLKDILMARIIANLFPAFLCKKIIKCYAVVHMNKAVWSGKAVRR